MDREILFRGMDDNKRLIQGYFFQIWEDCFILWGTTNGVPNMTKVDPATVGQFTGLCDKNGFTKIFEGDIIRLDGTIGGNIYEEKELLKDTTNLIIKGVGTSSWATTEQEAIMRGCHYAE